MSKAQKTTVVITVIAVIGIVAGLLIAGHSTKAPAPQKAPAVQQTAQKPDLGQLFTIVNQERQKAGEAPLTRDAKLDASAAAKCDALVQQNAFSHDLPSGVRWESFIQQAEGYQSAGENLATGSYTAETLTSAWMASPEHRVNILNPVFTNVGYAECYSSNKTVFDAGNIVVQQFTQE